MYLILCAGCHPGSANDAEMRQQLYVMEETHSLAMQQMVVTHNSELENLASKIRELQSELQVSTEIIGSLSRVVENE